MACLRKRRGRWVIDFYDQHGKRRWKTLKEGTTKKAAMKELRQTEDLVEKGDFVSAKEIPPLIGFHDEARETHVDGVADMWLEVKRQKRRESTCHTYEGHIEKHLKPYFGKTLVSRIKLDSVEAFIRHCLDSGVSVPTTRKILRTLQNMMTYACRKKWIYSNPVKEAEKPENEHEHDEKKEGLRTLDPAKLRKLVDAVGWYPKKDRKTGKTEWIEMAPAEKMKFKTLLMTAASTGMRQGEILGLKWSDIDFAVNQITVNRTFNHGRFYAPKSKYSKRKIDIGPQVVTQLKGWKLACPKTELDLVFPNAKGNPIDANNLLNRVYNPALKKAKLPRIRFHDLRHTYASLLISQGENPKYIQNQMGHSSIQVTYDIYGHLMNTENQESASKLGNTIFGENWGTGSRMVAGSKKDLAKIS
jgi:integrase